MENLGWDMLVYLVFNSEDNSFRTGKNGVVPDAHLLDLPLVYILPALGHGTPLDL